MVIEKSKIAAPEKEEKALSHHSKSSVASHKSDKKQEYENEKNPESRQSSHNSHFEENKQKFFVDKNVIHNDKIKYEANERKFFSTPHGLWLIPNTNSSRSAKPLLTGGLGIIKGLLEHDPAYKKNEKRFFGLPSSHSSVASHHQVAEKRIQSDNSIKPSMKMFELLPKSYDI